MTVLKGRCLLVQPPTTLDIYPFFGTGDVFFVDPDVDDCWWFDNTLSETIFGLLMKMNHLGFNLGNLIFILFDGFFTIIYP